MRGLLFHLPTDLRVCTTDTWFSHCWVECIQRGITIDGNIQDFSMQCERDQMITEIFLRSGYREAELATLNRCRMYLHVIYLSDVCNGQVKERQLNHIFGLETESLMLINIHGPKF